MKTRRIIIRATAAVGVVLALMWLYHVLRSGVDVLTRDATAPYGRFVLSVRGFLDNAADLTHGLARARAEREDMLSELSDLRVRQLFLEDLQRENARLRRALDLDYAPPGFVCAEVVSRGGASGWWKTIRINKGTKHGVLRNRAVLDTQGLVGRVISASTETADVLLLTDVNSKLSCVIEGVGPGARGILSGSGVSGPDDILVLLHMVEPMSLAYLAKDLEVETGARILTSGLGGLFPAGLPVGEVVDASTDSTGLFQRARVAPYVDFASLDRVFVLVGRDRPSLEEVVR